jgi:hypothetical protein
VILSLTLALAALAPALAAGDVSATAPVEPPAGTIHFTFDPAAPVKGRDAKVRVRLEARDRAGAALAPAAPPRLVASTGKLGPVTPGQGPGRFEADWQPSDSPQPEVLGLVAILPRCPLCATPLAIGAARLPVAAAIDLPGKTDPGVVTRVEIAGRVWGPVRADADGRFALPVIVPPGTRWGLATSESAVGNARRTKLDLRLPDAPGLRCAAWPERLPADGSSEAGLFCVGWNASGRAAELRKLRATARRGSVSSPEPGDDGTWRARYRSPSGGAGMDAITFAWEHGGATARDEVAVGLAAGAPASIAWRVDGEPAVPGAQVRVEARVVDSRGDAVGEALVDGRPIEGGTLRVRPELGDGVQRVKLEWTAAPGDAPATLSLGQLAGSWVAVVRDVDQRPVADVPLRFGSGARAVTDARGEARGEAKGATETVEGPAGLRAAGRAGTPPTVTPIAIAGEGRIALRPPGSVDVDAVQEGGWIRWKVRSPDGAALADRAVKVTSATVELGPVEKEPGGGRCALRGGRGLVALEDVESGATALLEVR